MVRTSPGASRVSSPCSSRTLLLFTNRLTCRRRARGSRREASAPSPTQSHILPHPLIFVHFLGCQMRALPLACPRLDAPPGEGRRPAMEFRRLPFLVCVSLLTLRCGDDSLHGL